MDIDARRERVLANLIPYDSAAELEARVRSLFEFWDHNLGDLYPEVQHDKNSRQGVLLWYTTGIGSWDDPREEEIEPLIRYLPLDHEIVKEMVKQAKSNLRELVTKPAEELTQHNPRYFNSLSIAKESGQLPEELKAAAFYIINASLLTDLSPPEEIKLSYEATRAMLAPHNDERNPAAGLFLNLIKEKQVCLQFVIRGTLELEGVDEAVKTLIALYNYAEGRDTFVYLGIRRDLFFKGSAYRIARTSPTSDFKGLIDKNAPQHLRDRLYELFSER